MKIGLLVLIFIVLAVLAPVVLAFLAVGYGLYVGYKQPPKRRRRTVIVL